MVLLVRVRSVSPATTVLSFVSGVMTKVVLALVVLIVSAEKNLVDDQIEIQQREVAKKTATLRRFFPFAMVVVRLARIFVITLSLVLFMNMHTVWTVELFDKQLFMILYQ